MVALGGLAALEDGEADTQKKEADGGFGKKGGDEAEGKGLDRAEARARGVGGDAGADRPVKVWAAQGERVMVGEVKGELGLEVRHLACC